MKRIIALVLCLTLTVALASCGNSSTLTQGTEAPQESSSGNTAGTEGTATNVGLDSSNMFTARDKEIGYDESTATKIALNNESVTITEEGVYVLSGSLSDGQVIVEVADSETVQLVLSDVDINSNSSAAIYVKSADKVLITLAAGSENTLSVGGEYAQDSENNVDGVVFSKSDITFNGTGTLTVNTSFGHGIVGKDDVVFVGGTYIITAEKHGISANDSVRIADGNFTISAGKDGIQAENTEDETLGFIYIADGTFSVTAGGDGISASGVVEVEDGTFDVKTGEGSASVTLQSDELSFDMGRQEQQTTTATEEDTTSQKGLKTDSALIIHNGTFNMDTVDDAFHAAGDIEISNGEFTIKSGDDGIHSDAAVVIDDGNIAIPYCYEGIEGLSVTVNGGTIDIVSYDDGLNSAGGTDSSGLGGRGGGDPFATTEGAFITINGGTITIVSDGDSVDSNGDLTINGGTLNLTCNGNGNTAIDASGTYSHPGGDITTNDGSESGNSMTGGGPGGGGGQRPSGERPEGMEPPSGDRAIEQ